MGVYPAGLDLLAKDSALLFHFAWLMGYDTIQSTTIRAQFAVMLYRLCERDQ